MSDAGYDDSQLASQIQVDGSTYMIPVVNFVYPMFTNDALLAQAGSPPAVHAHRVRRRGEEDLGPRRRRLRVGAAAFARGPQRCAERRHVLGLGLGRLHARGRTARPHRRDVTSAADYVQQLWDDGVIAPGSFTMKEQDKVEEFTNGRVGMMIDSLAHIKPHPRIEPRPRLLDLGHPPPRTASPGSAASRTRRGASASPRTPSTRMPPSSSSSS